MAAKMHEMACKLTRMEKKLQNDIIKSLQGQGFHIKPNLAPAVESKASYKRIQKRAKLTQLGTHKKFLDSFSGEAKRHLLNGRDITPEKINLELREVKPDGFHARLFRWWNLIWWSMPFQQPYGRQMRFFLWDTYHDAPFGMFLLQSPILHFATRDKFLEIPKKSLDYWANMSMNAQRVGALPPYNGLLGGKMSALAMVSNEVRKIYRIKYASSVTLLQKRRIKADLLFITTTSAFGKSSMYDRLKYQKDLVAVPIGYTKGMGTFHLSENLTKRLYDVLKSRGVETNTSYGHGPSRKLKLFKMAFKFLGMNQFHSHGIQRQVYLFPIARNIRHVIHDSKRPRWHDRPFDDLQEYWKERWALPRCRRMPEWQEFDSKKFFQKNVKSVL